MEGTMLTHSAKRIVYRTEKERKNIMQERKINPFQQTRQDEKSQKNCKKVQKKGYKEERKTVRRWIQVRKRTEN